MCWQKLKVQVTAIPWVAMAIDRQAQPATSDSDLPQTAISLVVPRAVEGCHGDIGSVGVLVGGRPGTARTQRAQCAYDREKLGVFATIGNILTYSDKNISGLVLV